MRPLYDARIADLGPGDFVRVECAACGHDELIPAVGLTQGLRLPPYIPILDLVPRLPVGNAISAAGWCCRSGGQTLVDPPAA
jgi:hypothetical protein